MQGPRCWLAFVLANLATLGSVVGFTIPALIARHGDGSAGTIESSSETRLGVVFSAVVYSVLCVCLACYGWLIWNQRKGDGRRRRSASNSR